MFRKQQRRQMPQYNFLAGISRFQHQNKDNISVIIVPSLNKKDPKGISYKVTREVGLSIQERMDKGLTVPVVIKDRGELTVRPIIAVCNNPTRQLDYAMRWAYQVLNGHQFYAEHRQELNYVDSVSE